MGTPAKSGRFSLTRKRAAASLTVLALFIAVGWGMGFIGKGPQAGRPASYRSLVGAQEPRKSALVEGVSLAYSDSGGSGPTILCLHAIGHGARDFADFSRRMASDYRVIALDFPGQGNSASDFQPASGTRYAQLLAGFIEQLHLHSVILLGNSIGGAAAVRYTYEHPDQVQALVLCDSGGLQPPSPTGRVFIGLFVQFFAAGRRGASWYPWAFEKYYRRVLVAQAAHEERDRIVRSAYEIAPVLEQAWKSFATSEEDLTSVLDKVLCPVMLAWARNDFVIPLTGTQAAFKHFPNHRLEVFDGGHAAFLEDPDHFERSVRGFLSGLPSEAAHP